MIPHLYRTLFQEIRSASLFTEMKKISTYKTDSLTSKMWILPDGQVISLSQWHYRWILANKDRVAKYGLDTTNLPDDEQTVRIASIKAGFFRVNYEHKNGGLTVEGLAAKLNKKVKDAIIVIVVENIQSIDRFKLTLTNESVTALVRSKSVELFTYDDDDQKLAAVESVLG